VKFCYLDGVLTSYPEIRDRIYKLALERGLHVYWRESDRYRRTLLLYDSRQIVVGRATVPLRRIDRDDLAELARDLTGTFGEGWME